MTITDVILEPNIFCGVISIVISIPLLYGKVPMNHAYGFRIRKAFTSNENWYAINRYGARQLMTWSIVMVISGVTLLFVAIPPLARLIPLVITLTIAIVKTLLFAKTLPG